MILIDSHAHLDLDDFSADLPEVLQRAVDADIKRIINISIDAKSILACLELIEKYSFIHAAVGIHPHEADKVTDDDIQLVKKHATHPKVAAIGEIGLDYHRNYAGRQNQRRLFRRMIEIALEAEKPMVIHSRNALEETIEILRQAGKRQRAGVFHCFAADAEAANQVIAEGFYVSFTGNITYPKSQLPLTAAGTPIERILLETDCPFMAPQPRRGKRSEPADVRFIAEKLAEIKELSLEDIARITTFNVHRLFGVGPQPESKIAYPIRNSLYLNLTNRCSCDCVFCPRLKNPVVKGHSLALEREPEFGEVVKAVEDMPGGFDELVFCGFGESTLRFDLVKKLAQRFRSRFKRIRLDTNGHGSLINGRDITGEVVQLFDAVSVSINTADPEKYRKINRPDFGAEAYPAMLDFIRGCREKGLEVTATIVGFPGAETEAAEDLAKSLGVKFRVRKYNDLG